MRILMNCQKVNERFRLERARRESDMATNMVLHVRVQGLLSLALALASEKARRDKASKKEEVGLGDAH